MNAKCLSVEMEKVDGRDCLSIELARLDGRCIDFPEDYFIDLLRPVLLKLLPELLPEVFAQAGLMVRVDQDPHPIVASPGFTRRACLMLGASEGQLAAIVRGDLLADEFAPNCGHGRGLVMRPREKPAMIETGSSSSSCTDTGYYPDCCGGGYGQASGPSDGSSSPPVASGELQTVSHCCHAELMKNGDRLICVRCRVGARPVQVSVSTK